MPDLVQFPARIKKTENTYTIDVPKQALDKLGLKENDDAIVEIRKYLTTILPKKKN